MKGTDVCRCELARIEIHPDHIEEDAGALALQPRKALLVVTLARTQSVVGDLRPEPGEDDLPGPLDAVRGQCLGAAPAPDPRVSPVFRTHPA